MMFDLIHRAPSSFYVWHRLPGWMESMLSSERSFWQMGIVSVIELVDIETGGTCVPAVIADSIQLQ